MTTAKLRFFWQNWFDSAVVTATSEAAGYPVENLQDRGATWDWRSIAADLTGVEIVADLGVSWATKPIRSFIFENMNLRTTSVVELGGHATNPTGLGHTTFEKVITVTAAMVAARRIVVTLPADEIYRWWRLMIGDAGNPDGFLSGSRIYLGPEYTTKYHYRDFSSEPVNQSTINRATGGEKAVSKEDDYMSYALIITIQGTAEIDAFYDISAECGIHTPLWISFDSTDDAGNTVYVSFSTGIKLPARTRPAAWVTTINLEQEL